MLKALYSIYLRTVVVKRGGKRSRIPGELLRAIDGFLVRFEVEAMSRLSPAMGRHREKSRNTTKEREITRGYKLRPRRFNIL